MLAPNISQYKEDAFSKSGTAIATWLTLPTPQDLVELLFN